MMTDEDLDKIVVMGNLIDTMVAASKQGLVDIAVAADHVNMYATVISETILKGKKAEVMT